MNINIVNNPITFVLFSFVNKFLLNFIYYSIIFYNLIIYMRKSKKNIRKRNKTFKKCLYTDEAKRIIKYTRELRKKNKSKMKTLKNKNTQK